MSSAKKPPRKKAPLAEGEREPTEQEAAAIVAARAARETRPVRASFAERPGAGEGVFDLMSPHSDIDGQARFVAETLGTTSGDFVGTSILHLANLTVRNGESSIEGLNASMALIGAIQPANELEAALALQMAATHELSIDMLRRTRNTNDREAMREYGNLATKLSRTFTGQMKQLSDWRRGGEQIVRHIHIYEGGQAVVAETVNVGGQGNGKSLVQPHEGMRALSRPDSSGVALPAAADEGEAPLLPARRGTGKRRAEGE